MFPRSNGSNYTIESFGCGRRRMLFLHDEFLTPACYEDKLAKAFFDTSVDAGWDVVTIQSPRRTPDKIPDLVKTLFQHLDIHPEWINSEQYDDGTKAYHGLHESLDFLQSYLQKQPQFHVIAGHSNGALMASIFSLYIEAVPDWLLMAK
jgi:hypothetical protein